MSERQRTVSKEYLGRNFWSLVLDERRYSDSARERQSTDISISMQPFLAQEFLFVRLSPDESMSLGVSPGSSRGEQFKYFLPEHIYPDETITKIIRLADGKIPVFVRMKNAVYLTFSDPHKVNILKNYFSGIGFAEAKGLKRIGDSRELPNGLTTRISHLEKIILTAISVRVSRRDMGVLRWRKVRPRIRSFNAETFALMAKQRISEYRARIADAARSHLARAKAVIASAGTRVRALRNRR
jgi:hypothetical protein